ncbi:MAG: EutN/CcmL family microcompartment protein [Phycisphaerales bacterium]
MQLALIQGNATATVRHPSLRGQRLLIGQQLNARLQPVGDPQLMLDQMGAGAGDVVLISSDGRGLRDMIGHSNSPARWYTIGLLDSIDNVRAYQQGVTA